jgi:hypothetical protein
VPNVGIKSDRAVSVNTCVQCTWCAIYRKRSDVSSSDLFIFLIQNMIEDIHYSERTAAGMYLCFRPYSFFLHIRCLPSTVNTLAYEGYCIILLWFKTLLNFCVRCKETESFLGGGGCYYPTRNPMDGFPSFNSSVKADHGNLLYLLK